MSKYSLSFKLQVVKHYLSGLEGYKATAKRFGIDHSAVRKWSAVWKLHGEAGLTTRRFTYSPVFKESVILYMREHRLSVREVCATFSIPAFSTVCEWERLYDEGGLQALTDNRRRKKTMPDTPGNKSVNTPQTPLNPDEREELEQLRVEVAYLKKPSGLTQGKKHARTRQKTQVVNELRPQHPLARLLKAAELARSTFYWQLACAKKPDKYADDKHQILALFHKHKGRYGYRRITLAGRRQGSSLNHKTVQRLMQQLDLTACIRRKKYNSYKGRYGKAAGNVLNRQFSADKPNQKWVTDVTEFKIAGEKLYLSPVLDLYNGEIVAYQMEHLPVLSMVDDMLSKALSVLSEGEYPLVHSDQGWQYQMAHYQKRLREAGLKQSMSRKGNCYDNAVIESFFGTLKTECLYLEEYKSIRELRDAIDEYIYYYNHERIKQKLKGLSPVEYRTQAQIAA
ncbi:IS3 family transposase [Buttiauxella noackiae]|uniref:IS3 family transposase n=2 Tax=Buttiauxella noackiae TaxID=82992 RepID=UPI0028D50F2A|nr:IS3 family transposase [Buttiauxella noackiae]